MLYLYLYIYLYYFYFQLLINPVSFFRFFTDQGLERHLLGSHGLVTSSMQEAANKGKDAGRCPVCGRVWYFDYIYHKFNKFVNAATIRYYKYNLETKLLFVAESSSSNYVSALYNEMSRRFALILSFIFELLQMNTKEISVKFHRFKIGLLLYEQSDVFYKLT